MAALGAFVFGFLGALAGSAISMAQPPGKQHPFVYAGLGGAVGGGLGALL